MTDIFGPANAANAVTVRPGDTRSFGLIDTFFKDCTSTTADDGTDIEAAWLNAITAILRALARGNGLTGAGSAIVAENNADDNILLEAIQHLIQRNKPRFAVDVGTTNTVAVTVVPAPAELIAGMTLCVKVAASNTGASTANVNGTVKPIKRPDGRALMKGDLLAGGMACLSFDGTNWQLQSFVPTLGRTTLLSLAAAQAIPHNVETAITWPSVPVIDTDGMFSSAAPTRVTIPAGVSRFRVQYEVCYEVNTVGSRKARILMDGLYEGSGLPAARIQAAGSDDVSILQGAGAICDLGALAPDGSHYLELRLVQDSGAPLNVRANNTWISIEPLA